jgi:hypothetical protein
MATFRITLTLILLCSFTAAMPAGETAPATQSETVVDLSSPKAALLSVYGALRAGDIAAARRCMLFADAAQAENFAIAVTELWAPLSVMHAMEARFGAGSRKLFSAASLEKTADQAVDEINGARIDVTGNTAVVSEQSALVDPLAENQVTGITLKEHNRHWRIVASTFPEMSGEIPAAQLSAMRAQKDAVAAACKNILARLSKGEFQSADEAYAAYLSLAHSPARLHSRAAQSQ